MDLDWTLTLFDAEMRARPAAAPGTPDSTIGAISSPKRFADSRSRVRMAMRKSTSFGSSFGGGAMDPCAPESPIRSTCTSSSWSPRFRARSRRSFSVARARATAWGHTKVSATALRHPSW